MSHLHIRVMRRGAAVAAILVFGLAQGAGAEPPQTIPPLSTLQEL
jgi:hypothetical protein